MMFTFCGLAPNVAAAKSVCTGANIELGALGN